MRNTLPDAQNPPCSYQLSLDGMRIQSMIYTMIPGKTRLI